MIKKKIKTKTTHLYINQKQPSYQNLQLKKMRNYVLLTKTKKNQNKTRSIEGNSIKDKN